MTKSIDTTVANEILQTIRALDYWALGAWGAHSFDKTEDGLYFRVRGERFTGRVGVIYHYASDQYIVGSYRSDGTVQDEYSGVYAEDLVRVLDRIIG